MFGRERSTDCFNQFHDRISCKRKFDDYGFENDEEEEEDEEFSDHIITVRMKKNEEEEEEFSDLINNSSGGGGGEHMEIDEKTHFETRVLESVECSSSSSSSSSSIGEIHFFVRMISGGKTIVIHAKSDDTVESVHEQIHKITGIPKMVQRLVYRGKQLQLEQTLHECSIENDSGLQLVGRMRSTDYPETWRAVDDLVFTINRLCRGEMIESFDYFVYRIKHFLKMTPNDCGVKMMTPKDNCVRSLGHLQIFKTSGASFALVRLFLSGVDNNKFLGEESIKLFLSEDNEFLPKCLHDHCALIVLDFCKLLFGTARHEPIYLSCRKTLGLFLETIDVDQTLRYFNYAKESEVIEDFFPFVSELAYRVSGGLKAIRNSSLCNGFSSIITTLDSDVREFTAFSHHLCKAIEDHLHQKVPLCVVHPFYVGDVEKFRDIFLGLVSEVDKCLQKVEETLRVKGVGELQNCRHGWTHYLSVLKELHGISRLYEGAKETLSSVMRARRSALNVLIRCLKRTDDSEWLLQYKDLTIFETRRHLVMTMFPDMRDDYEELLEMLIDRSQLLTESFRYITNADPEALRSGIFMEFKNEEATGPGVLREWFFLVCQAIFNPQNALFLTCPGDHRRFFPNPASKVHPLHLEYFGFCGRIIALALMHKVQIGIAFDRVFFLQLAGELVTLEDVRDADPCLYMSCKQILEMDPDFLDTDSLGLTFVREIEELGGPRRVVELCSGGNDIAVNSKNRKCYVNLLIQHRFVTSVSQQVTYFSRGFTDILRSWKYQKLFFQSLELKDLDRMLLGCDGAISVRDWKTHTDYNGYKETDDQIVWFWKVVETMSAEQQRVLLFFWTSVKYLPQEGFSGLSSRLNIYKTSNSCDRLPSSHTCFYRLCLPPYSSLTDMNRCLHLISQEQLSCSFGLW